MKKDDDSAMHFPSEVPEPNSPLEEKLMNVIAELEGRIEQLETDCKKLKSGLPQLGW